MRQVFVSSYPTPLGLAAFANPVNLRHWDNAEAEISAPWPIQGVFRNLKIELTGSATVTFTLRINGVDTGIVIGIVSGTSGSSTGVDVAVAAGDLISLHATHGGSVKHCSIEFEGTTARMSGYMTSGGQPSTAVRYNALFRGGLGWASADGLTAQNVVGVAGVVTELYLALEVAPGSGNAWTAVVMKNGVAQDGTSGTPDTSTEVADSATLGSRTFSLALSPGDLVSIRITPTNSPATTTV